MSKICILPTLKKYDLSDVVLLMRHSGGGGRGVHPFDDIHKIVYVIVEAMRKNEKCLVRKTFF